MKTENNNEQLQETHVHILLFKCPKSGEPITVASLSASRGLEEVDSRAFPLHCECGWSGNLLGVQRLKHWVEDWSGWATS